MNNFFTNPRLTVISILFIFALGVSAAFSLARQEDPTMVERYANVLTFLPGATANRVESLISEPIETKLREISEIKKIQSVSRAGLSVLSVELYDHVAENQVDGIWSEIRDKLGDVQPTLPAATSEPDLQLSGPIASTIIVALKWNTNEPIQLSLLSRLAQSLKIKLANMPGTKESNTYGAINEEILVSANPYALASAGLTTVDISRIIAAADTKQAAGRLSNSYSDMLVEVDAELISAERIARIPLKTQTGNGQTLRVSDVADVRKHAIDPPQSMSQHGTQRAVFVNAKMEKDLIIDDWIAGAYQVIDEFKATLPKGVQVQVVYDQNHYTGERMRALLTNLFMALAIVMLVLMLFMGVRSALTVGIALPLSGGMVLAGMSFLNIPLHQMSVTGLIIALGLLIDNAIVIIEDYKLRRRKGADIALAIEQSVSHLRIPLGASTLTTVFAFMPIVLAPGGIGDFTGTIGISVSLAVISSFLLAMSVVPAIAGFIERRYPPKATEDDVETSAWWRNGYSNHKLTRRYRASVVAVLKRPWKGIAIGLVIPVIGFGLAPTLTQQFFPPVDRNQFQVQLTLPKHSSIFETQASVAIADEVLRSNARITDTFWTIGTGPPRTYYNVMLNNDGLANFAGGWVTTQSASATLELLPALQRELSDALPNAEIMALPFEQGPPTNAPIEVRVLGPDLDVLRNLGEQLRLLLSGIEDVTYTRASLSVSEPKLVFAPNENAAAAAGLSTGQIPGLLASALVGVPAGSVQEANTKLDIRVRLANANRDKVSDIRSLPMPTANANSILTSNRNGIPLDQLGTWSLQPAATTINRYQGERLTVVQAYLIPFTLPATVMGKFEQRLAASDFAVPQGYRLEIGGEAEERSRSVGNLLSIFAFFAVAMIAVVVLSLNSFRQAALIAFVGFLSVGLALFGLRLFGWPLGYTALIGTLGMVGLAINGAIIVLSALKADPAAQSGDVEGSADVVVDATRHIISTTVTTIGGFVPLILFGGTFWPPLATAIAGGVGGSAILALYTVPAVYQAITRRQPQASNEAKVEAKAEANTEVTDFPIPVVTDRVQSS